jgi:hypothetical protein
MSDDEVENLFVETEQYSARVIDIGLWIPPVLPWIKRQPNDWLPEKFGLQIGDQYLVLKADELSSFREQIKEARAKGEPFVEFGKEKVHIPATEEAERSLSNLIGVVRPPAPLPGEKSAEEQKPASTQRQVLIVEENFDKTGFTRKIDPRAGEKTDNAYHLFGEGPLNLILAPFFVANIEVLWESPDFARWILRFGSYARVPMFDKRGTGIRIGSANFLAWTNAS